MSTRVAVIAIIIENSESAEGVNGILHNYRQYIIGRMGIPYREKGINIISVAVDAPDRPPEGCQCEDRLFEGCQFRSFVSSSPASGPL